MSLGSSLQVTLGMSSGVFMFKSAGDFRYVLGVFRFKSAGDFRYVLGVFRFKSAGDFRYVFRCLYVQVCR